MRNWRPRDWGGGWVEDPEGKEELDQGGGEQEEEPGPEGLGCRGLAGRRVTRLGHS